MSKEKEGKKKSDKTVASKTTKEKKVAKAIKKSDKKNKDS